MSDAEVPLEHPSPPPPPYVEPSTAAQDNSASKDDPRQRDGQEQSPQSEGDEIPMTAENVKKLQDGQLDLKSSLCGNNVHSVTLRNVAIILLVLLVLSSFVLLGGAIWALGEALQTRDSGSSCCLPQSCNSSGEFLLPMDSASTTFEDPHPLKGDSGLCRFIQPEIARGMGCFSDVAQVYDRTLLGGNCSVTSPRDCRGRSSFPTDLGVWAASLGFAGFFCSALFIIAVSTDIFAALFRPCCESRFPLLFTLVALTLLCTGAGIGCVAQPLEVAQRTRPVEMEAATAQSGENAVFLTATAIGFSPLYFNEWCGTSSQKRAQLVAFLPAVDSRAFMVLLVGHGMVFFWTVLCLAATWQAGGLLNVLLAREDEAEAETHQQQHQQLSASRSPSRSSRPAALSDKLLLEHIHEQRQLAAQQREMQYRRLHPHEGDRSSEYYYSPARGGDGGFSIPRGDGGHSSQHRDRDRSSSNTDHHHKSLSRGDNVHPKMTDDELLVQTRIKLRQASTSQRGEGSPGWLQNSQPPLCVDANGRMLI